MAKGHSKLTTRAKGELVRVKSPSTQTSVGYVWEQGTYMGMRVMGLFGKAQPTLKRHDGTMVYLGETDILRVENVQRLLRKSTAN